MIRLDPLLFLFLIEAAGVFCALAIIFFIRSRRYRKLYDQALSSPAVMQDAEPPVAAVIVPEPVIPPLTAEEPGVVDNEELPTAEAVPQNVRKLLEIIDFQKQKIMDLLCMRDMLDDAHKQLDMLRQKNTQLEGRIVSLVQASASPEEFQEASSLMATSNRELGEYIGVLQRNSISLGEKMAEWEEQLIVLWDDARKIADELPEGERVVSAGSSGEFDELREKLRDREEKLAGVQEELRKMAAQYEDIEKEYMILYSKQQAAEAEAANKP